MAHLSDRITRIEVHLSDENSLKGGDHDKRCMLEARIAGMQPLAVTHLAESLVAAVRVQGIGGLVRWSTGATTAEVASLGPVVVQTADQGDAVAADIVDRGVELLGKLATAAGAGPVPVALSGGLIAPGRPLRERIMQQLVERQQVSVLEAPVDPCRGGPILAERLTRR